MSMDLTGRYQGSNGGIYYVRQVGDQVFWFGEGSFAAFANVMVGAVTGNTIRGRWWDVPKGATQGFGSIELSIEDDGAVLNRISESGEGGLAAARWIKITTFFPFLFPVTLGLHSGMGSRPAQFSGGETNLTGAWDGNDFGYYYVREVGSDVVWLGVHRLSGNRQPEYANVFIGRRSGNLVRGEWVDVPFGRTACHGSLTLRVNNPQQMERTAVVGGYGGSRWRRSTPARLWGFVDMHTHPASRWGFGEELFFGDQDGDPATALGSCNGVHNYVQWPFQGNDPQQNLIRNQLVDKLDPHQKVPGYPSFQEWPRFDGILHQQMWYEWIQRAYDGGLRAMVALAVNSHTLADAAETSGPNDDLRSMNKQLRMIRFLARSCG